MSHRKVGCKGCRLHSPDSGRGLLVAAVNAVMICRVPLSEEHLDQQNNDNLFKKCLEPCICLQSYDLLECIGLILCQQLILQKP
jgi:hypothetical protein